MNLFYIYIYMVIVLIHFLLIFFCFSIFGAKQHPICVSWRHGDIIFVCLIGSSVIFMNPTCPPTSFFPFDG